MLIIAISFTSCIVEDNNYNNDAISLEELLQSKDLWYIDSNQTVGSRDVRFLSLAFTLSFQNGNIFANNNLVDLGSVGNGYGDQIGYYDTYGQEIRIDHDLDGNIDLEVIQVSNNKIKLRSIHSNVTYTLIGYSVSNFDYDQVFYDNIEYFLQEYVAWEKSATIGGTTNAFDDENFLAYIPENVNVFQSSQDVVGTSIHNLLWDFTGEYEVFDVQNVADLKILTLHYDGSGNEEFELSVIDDGSISLYHYNSDTTYEFIGRENIIYKKPSKDAKATSTKVKEGRKRFKVTRKTKTRKQHITKISNRKI